MVMNKNIVIIASILVLILGLFLVNHFRQRNSQIQVSNTSPSPSISGSPNPGPNTTFLGKPSGKDLQSLTPQEIEKLINGGQSVPPSVPYSQLTKPATCQLSGTLEFLNPTTYKNINNTIAYTGIDSPARQIKWNVSPTDDLKVGPNLVAGLQIPDGSSSIDATLPASPKSKSYALTASITYGRLINGDVKLYEAQCSGQTQVILDY
jgi:hypothetical protein